MCVYGYCRISTRQQSIDRQVRNIKASYDNAVMIQEAFTGTKLDRPEWNKLYKRLKSGDTVVFDSVSRMSRNADEGFYLYEELYNKGIELVFLQNDIRSWYNIFIALVDGRKHFPIRYWGQHIWARGYFCGTVGEVDQETIKRYIENQGKQEERDDNFTIVEE